ncbi:T9SS type A sorting domain-containing protein [Dyadobacter flavalbus]|uniref:T9SS type A sorting domain-containing protein n=1 Tax=Dyadobacter flavalbus TaxID=2579942 RepID=A0A5M8QYB2_9BACT|nr:T9SS type A sorting domain-containing protein [Dyadobacter flavalbus]KAA6438982.1 T9SS type A sorting domain-containing protein [Dyadobacter flavalbus]
MKFLLKLIYVCGLFGLFAAKSDDNRPENQSAVASQVICAGRTWTHDEFLGNFNGKGVYTIIHENRIYIRWDGNSDPSRIRSAFDNTAILLHLDTNRFPNDAQGNYAVNHCVNGVDPSTMSTGYLKPAIGNAIPCNNKLITDNLLLGTYVGTDRVKTYQFARIVDGLLRINFRRDLNNYNPNAFSLGLIQQTIAGENGSYMNPDLGFQLNYLEVQSCFWGDVPKYPDSVVGEMPNCASGPTLGTISNISQTGLRFAYSGSGVPNIDWRIKSNGTIVRSAKTGSLGSNTVDISFASLASGNYVLEIEGGDCVSSISSKSFTISTGPVNCLAGPNLLSISNITPTSLRFLFHGNGVPTIDWKIKSNGTTVRSARTPQLTSANVDINFASLTPGNYTMEIQGGDCISGVSSQSFKIAEPLPIHLVSFEGTALQNGIELSWTVVSEKNGQGFEILRLDEQAKTSEVIGKLALSEKPAGEYRFVDANPRAGTNYYQLKQIDTDGTFTKSRIISVEFNHIYELMAAPNPARDYIDVSYSARIAGMSDFDIYNVAGIRVSSSKQSLKKGHNSSKINISGLADGHYILKISYGDQSQNLRFIKVH